MYEIPCRTAFPSIWYISDHLYSIMNSPKGDCLLQVAGEFWTGSERQPYTDVDAHTVASRQLSCYTGSRGKRAWTMPWGANVAVVNASVAPEATFFSWWSCHIMLDFAGLASKIDRDLPDLSTKLCL